mgnify:FL=1
MFAKDFSHLYSDECNRRNQDKLSALFAYAQRKDVTFLGNGLPESKYFPWQSVSGTCPAPPFANGIESCDKSTDTFSFQTMKNDNSNSKLGTCGDSSFNLARGLQYQAIEGQPAVLDFIREHLKIIHKVGTHYQDWDAILSIGNCQAFDAIIRTFCNVGDFILAEEYSFSATINAAKAQGIKPVSLKMDDHGIIPEYLIELLDNWPTDLKKPKLLYTIPTGQNPLSYSLSTERKKIIYEVLQKHDILIVEDEPYYFLQTGDYVPKNERAAIKFNSHQEFIDSLATSFLSLDNDGRVLRMESYSKVLAPGIRLGFIAGSSAILKKISAYHLMSIMAPSGFSQTFLNELLNSWKQTGYLDWLIGLRHEYTLKRDGALDCLLELIPKELIENDVVRVSPPVAGMFFTVEVNAKKHSKFNGDKNAVEDYINEKFIEEGVIVAPGSWFAVGNPEEIKDIISNEDDGYIFYRMTFAASELPIIQEGIAKIANVIKSEFK